MCKVPWPTITLPGPMCGAEPVPVAPWLPFSLISLCGRREGRLQLHHHTPYCTRCNNSTIAWIRCKSVTVTENSGLVQTSCKRPAKPRRQRIKVHPPYLYPLQHTSLTHLRSTGSLILNTHALRTHLACYSTQHSSENRTVVGVQ